MPSTGLFFINKEIKCLVLLNSLLHKYRLRDFGQGVSLMEGPRINIKASQSNNRRKKLNIQKIKNEYITSNKAVIDTNQDNNILGNTNNNRMEKADVISGNDFVPDNKYYKKENNIRNDIYINKKNQYSKHKKKNRRRNKIKINTQIIKTIGTGVGAIATGMIFGYIILSFLFGTGNEEPLTVNRSNNTEFINPENNNILPIGQVISEQTIYLIQAGVFSNYSGAEAIVSQQKSLGKSAVVKQEESYYVFFGISDSKEQANLLKDLLVLDGKDLYVKEYILSERSFNMEESTFLIFSNFINTGQEIVEELSEASIQALVNPQYKIDYDQIQITHQTLLLDIQSLKTSLEAEDLLVEQELVKNMSDQINYAVAALNAYKKNPNTQYLWNIQELLIKYELYYEGYVKKTDI